MSIPKSHKKERLHTVYMRAVATQSEHTLIIGEEGDYGIDGHIQEIGLKKSGGKSSYSSTHRIFAFQLKATKNCVIKDGQVKYRLSADARERLLDLSGGVIPGVLIVYDLPDNVKAHIYQDPEKLTMLGCCYWEFMDKQALKRNTVYIPQTQIFNANAIQYILDFYQSELERLRNVNP